MSTLSTTNLKNPSSGSNNIVLATDGSATIATLSSTTITGTTIQGTIKSGTAKAYNWNGVSTNTFLDFESIPSWVKRITVMFDGVSTNGSSVYLFQLGDSGGVETTGYQAAGSNYVGVTTSTSGFPSHNNSAASTHEGAIVFTNTNGNTWSGFGNFASVTAGQVISIAGSKTLSGTLDRVRITTVNGTDTFDAGTINILYEG